MLRLGLYELQRPREYREDWIYILDLTIELGVSKCLVVLGIPQARWQALLEQGGGGLGHRDVEVLELQVLPSSKGAVIEQILRELAQRVGRPVQILSDHGNDLKKGVELYLRDHPNGIYTYDVTHWLALQLKAQLEPDERYQTFVKQCHRCRAQLQQTKLSGLMPPNQRTKARYFNADRLVKWGQQLLKYQQEDDFSHLNCGFIIDEQTLEQLSAVLPPPLLQRLTSLKGMSYHHLSDFTEAISQHLTSSVFEVHAALIRQAACLGRRGFYQKLGWLRDYQADLDLYTQIIDLTHQLERQLKQHGLNHHSLMTFIATNPPPKGTTRLQDFYAKLITYLAHEGGKVPQAQSLPATSDIIESLFGKYKLFSAKSCLKEIGPMILTLPLCTLEITTDLVKRALETVRGIDVEQWLHQVLGPSMLAKRKVMFRATGKDAKVA